MGIPPLYRSLHLFSLMVSSTRSRLLLLVDESPYPYEHEPMAQRVTRNIALLEERGWQVVLATIRTEWDFHDRLRRQGKEAYSLRSPHYWQVPIAAFRLARLLRRTGVDVIHASGVLAALITGMTRSVATKPIRIYERHHLLGRARVRLSSRLAARWSDHTIACSAAVKQEAIDADRSSPSAVTVVHAAGDPPRAVGSAEIASLRARLGFDAGAAVIVLVARLRPEKGHVVLIEALRVLEYMISRKIHAVFVGAGPSERAIRQSLRVQEPFTLHMVGHQADVAPWMAVADVVAMPSLSEPFGKVAYEVLAAGRPLVASRVGGIPEIVNHREDGLLVPPSDPTALAGALAEVLSSEDLRRRFEANGPATYETRFTRERRVAAWVACYEELLGRARGRVDPMGVDGTPSVTA